MLGLSLPSARGGQWSETGAAIAAPTPGEAANALVDLSVRDTVVQQIENQVPATDRQPPARTTLQGMITSVDERSNDITVQLSSGSQANFNVTDGLMFDAVHPGEYVEIVVEDVGGARTIVGLTKL